MNIDSCEAQVSNNLYKQVSCEDFIQVINWNPPDAKAYQTINIKFPWFEGIRRRRDSIDAIWVVEDILFLVELKCLSSESVLDIAKLRRITEQLTPDQLRIYMERQGAKIPTAIHQTALLIGVKIVNTDVAPDFTFLEIGKKQITPYFGLNVDRNVVRIIERICKPNSS